MMIVPTPVIAGLAAAALLSTIAPFAVHAFSRKRMILPARNIWLGVLFFILFAVALEGALHWYILRLNPVTAAALKKSAVGMVVYLAAAAALFEETARFIALRYFSRRVEGEGTAVSYGLGHGGFECLSVALMQIGAVVFCLLANMGKLDALTAPLFTSAQLAKAYAGATFPGILLSGTERITALLLQIGFSLVMWRAVTTGKARWFLLALGAHFTVDAVAFLAAKGFYPVMTLEIALVALGVVLAAAYVRAAPPKRPPG